ncbi:MAG: AraC family transcriptional regulator [Paludibacter sp.]|nr:AraC family transcriptional regulator [Paludibacter sp.]
MTSKEKSRNEYLARINRVLEYVEHHYTESVKLETLASVASFSPFHFHRIFTVLTGETPADYFQRIRIEKAAQQLKDYPQKSISDVVFDCGFSSMALFARTFKKHFGISATDYRHSEVPLLVKDGVYYSKKGQALSKKSKIYVALNHELCSVNLKQLIIMETKVTIKELPDMQVIYVRHTGAFDKVGEAYGKLMQFAGPRGLLASPSARTITVYHDDPSVTEISKVRQSACLTVNEDVQVNGEVGKMTVKGGKYAVGHFEIGVMEFEQAWNTMCLWLSESGYEPGEGNPMEYYYNDHTQHPEKKFILDICIPVKAL